MTDSEKLDLLLAEMAEMKTEIKGMKAEMNEKFERMDKRLSKLEVGQAGLTKELYMIDRKIADTYGVALDVLASTAENRKWLETGKPSLV